MWPHLHDPRVGALGCFLDLKVGHLCLRSCLSSYQAVQTNVSNRWKETLDAGCEHCSEQQTLRYVRYCMEVKLARKEGWF